MHDTHGESLTVQRRPCLWVTFSPRSSTHHNQALDFHYAHAFAIKKVECFVGLLPSTRHCNPGKLTDSHYATLCSTRTSRKCGRYQLSLRAVCRHGHNFVVTPHNTPGTCRHTCIIYANFRYTCAYVGIIHAKLRSMRTISVWSFFLLVFNIMYAITKTTATNDYYTLTWGRLGTWN